MKNTPNEYLATLKRLDELADKCDNPNISPEQFAEYEKESNTLLTKLEQLVDEGCPISKKVKQDALKAKICMVMTWLFIVGMIICIACSFYVDLRQG